MTLHPSTTTDDVVTEWPYGFQSIPEGESLYEYLGVFVSELQRRDSSIGELADQRFIETATGRELEKLGKEVGITRQAGEDDDSLRLRVQIGKAVAASNGTPEDIRTICAIAFGEDELDSITVSQVSGDPVLSFQIPSSLINDIPLSQSQLEDQLRATFPAGSDVTIITDDVFAFAESDGTAPAYGAGFGDGIWSG
jgi:hypothetical protein